ncbi:MAG: HU family DNA-binding protein [Streptococcaceae bacterium]|jgi:predicted histone-like DNA-binding protein|nr:HU family DNA-binding protein [Streptococcaceae bacterium]
MSVPYNVVPKVTPNKPEVPVKYFAVAKSRKKRTLKEIAKKAAQNSSISTADIHGAIMLVTELMCEYLAEGELIQLGDFGSFSLSLSSAGTSTMEEFNPKSIRVKKVLFKPGIELVEAMRNVKFERLKNSSNAPVEKEENARFISIEEDVEELLPIMEDEIESE